MKTILKKNKVKVIALVVLLLFIVLRSFLLPSLARFKNKYTEDYEVWNGLVTDSYKDGNGTKEDPYIISRGSELALLTENSKSHDYSNTYFKLDNDIILNKGSFKYKDNTLKYIVDDKEYYIKDNSYYSDINCLNKIGDINSLNPIISFKGHFDGSGHTIYGLFNNNGLFKDLNGEVNNLYLSNSYIKGNNTGILSNKIIDSNITNVVVDGVILSDKFENTDIDLDNYTTNGGISAYVYSSELINVINKADIINGYITGGLIGYMENTNITNAYSTGNIDSICSNLIGIIKGNNTIKNVYTKGIINGGLFGYIIDSNVSISDSFIATNNKLVLDIINSDVDSVNNYYVDKNMISKMIGIRVDSNLLKKSTFLKNYIEYDESNILNAWIFDDENYPILYIDDIASPYVEINTGNYMWNTYSLMPDEKIFNTKISLVLTDIDKLHKSEKYYFISNKIIKRKELKNVEWIKYSDIINIKDEGRYIVYVKTIDDDNNINYLNTDYLILDNSKSNIEIKMNDYIWNKLSEGVVYIDKNTSLDIKASDDLSGIKKIEYYISDKKLDDYNVKWINYQNPINIKDIGKYIIYVKVTDKSDFITYASTPLIIYNGYISSLKPYGYISGSKITNKSSIIYDFTYKSDEELKLNHYLVSSSDLPVNTEIILTDYNKNMNYKYIVSKKIDKIPFSEFILIGTKSSKYTEYSSSNEHYKIKLDFSNTDIKSGIFEINMIASDGTITRTTIKKNSFNIVDEELKHTISTTFKGNIYYNSASINKVTIKNNIKLNSDVIDTTYIDKKIGLAIKILDSNNELINKLYLKSLIFEVDGKRYIPDNDNIIRINLNDNKSKDIDLSITTKESISNLDIGTYYISINPYVTYDGLYYDKLIESNIKIPLIVNSYKTDKYAFNVTTQDNMIIKRENTSKLTFNFKHKYVKKPSIKVSLYKKKNNTAYNNEFELIDLKKYTNDTLSEFIPSIYNTNLNKFEINLKTNNMPKNIYKFVFDLYSGDTKIDSINKSFIVN